MGANPRLVREVEQARDDARLVLVGRGGLRRDMSELRTDFSRSYA